MLIFSFLFSFKHHYSFTLLSVPRYSAYSLLFSLSHSFCLISPVVFSFTFIFMFLLRQSLNLCSSVFLFNLSSRFLFHIHYYLSFASVFTSLVFISSFHVLFLQPVLFHHPLSSVRQFGFKWWSCYAAVSITVHFVYSFVQSHSFRSQSLSFVH